MMASKDIVYKEECFKLSYEIMNPKAHKVLLILHGWGSNKEIMKQAFSKELGEYKHLYLDMVGFGKSSQPSMVLTTNDYAKITTLFLEALCLRVDIVMGHSFGGKVATLLEPPCLVLLSSSGVLVPKVLKVRVKIALFKFLKPFKLERLHQIFVSDDAKGMSHAMYETFKNVVNEDFEDSFRKSKSETLLFWGKDDTATPLYSGEKIASLIQKSQFYPLEGDHFFFLHHAPFIATTLSQQTKG